MQNAASFAVLILTISSTAAVGQLSTESSSVSYTCTERGPHSRVWQSHTFITNDSGEVITNTVSYTELCTGICYLQNGQHVDSVEQINIVGTGAQAKQGPCQVTWAADASTAGGAVKFTSPGGSNFTSGVYGLSLRDISSGSNVLIATITNSIGVLNGNNEIDYPLAFSGLQADIQNIYMLSGFEQNIILRQQLPSPSDYGLNPDTTYFDVLTQFYNAPEPEFTIVETNAQPDDVQIDFGDVGIGRGTVFLTPDGQAPRVNVTKHWEQSDNGTFLIEEVPYTTLTNLLESLPPSASVTKPDPRIRRTASLKSLLRERNSVPTRDGAIKKVAKLSRPRGVVIDYTMLTGSLTNYVFQGDTTYYVSGAVNLYGSATFEGGTVVKFTNTASACLKELDFHSNFLFSTGMYLPAVFTSANDNSVGDGISGSTGTPSTNGLATYLYAANSGNSNVLIERARFSYANTAFWSQSDTNHIFRHCQFVDCVTNVGLYVDTSVSFQNILSTGSGAMLEGWEIAVDGENMTVDSCNAFAVTNTGLWGHYSGGLTNCLLTAVDNTVNDFTFKDTTKASSGSGIYQIVGAAGYYLANNSPYRDAGTSTINSQLLSDLGALTTYPPVVLAPQTLASNLTFFPQAQRDTDTIDVGYHYDPMDFSVYLAISNATVTVLPGTVLGGYGNQYGIWVYTNGIFNCNGTATAPNYIVRYNNIQEQSNTNWESTSWEASLLTPQTADTSSISISFTVWPSFTDFGQTLSYIQTPFTLQNCQFYNGIATLHYLTVSATNCLFQRVNTIISDSVGGSGPNTSVPFCNNLFWNGELSIGHYDSGTFTFRDNFLDQTTFALLSFHGVSNNVNVCSNNAYVTTNYGLVYPTNDIIVLTSSPAFETGALGYYYYPSNLSLIHAGSQLASAAGLYHYTVLTNESSTNIEGTNIVSIGFHYVGVGNNGQPIDSNGDGIPDYLEDANGNGVVDSGELDWLVNGDMGLTVLITQPANNSAIP